MSALLLSLFLSAALEGDPQFREAQRHVDAFELEKAASIFEEISKRPGLAPADRALALVWLGIAYAELRDEARAALAFEDAVTADPLIVLPKDSSPKIKALLEDARARVRLRSQAAPPSAPAVSPDPAPTPTPTQASGPAPAQAGSASGLLVAGVATAIAGSAVAVAGGAIWGVGLALRGQAEQARYQDEAAALNERSAVAQIAGQVGVGVGVAALVVGGVLLALSFVE